MNRRDEDKRECASLYFYGESFEKIAKTKGLSSSTIHRWSQGNAWREEIDRLTREAQKNREEILANTKTRYRKLLESSGLDAVELAIKILRLAKDVTETIDVSAITEPEEKFKILSQLARVFKDLQTCGAASFVEIFGLDREDEEEPEIEILFEGYTPEELSEG